MAATKTLTVTCLGIPWETMHKDFRGEVVYNAETDVHFPNLTVGQTLSFAARARTPRARLPGVTREQWAEHMRDVVMAVFGLTHTINTRVGNEFIRGVSGGERKRVSIAEVALSGAPLQCWDNSTRGLDSATALEFVKTVNMSAKYMGSTAVIAIYQASQSIYDVCALLSLLQFILNMSRRSSTRLRCFMRVDKYTLDERRTQRNSSSIWVSSALTVKQLRIS